MMKFTDISKIFRYKNKKIFALDHFNLNISQNDMVAIMGQSGSGKSTLLNIAGGILKPTCGKYFFDGKDMNRPEAEMAKFRNEYIGFILQHFALIYDQTAFYNISLPLKYKKMEKTKIKEKVLAVADSLGISNKLEMFPHMLSGGERQRVAIARAIISNPKVILADEPTGSLDNDNKNEVLCILNRLNQNGTTILLATHDPSVAEICKRKIIIQNGKNISI